MKIGEIKLWLVCLLVLFATINLAFSSETTLTIDELRSCNEANCFIQMAQNELKKLETSNNDGRASRQRFHHKSASTYIALALLQNGRIEGAKKWIHSFPKIRPNVQRAYFGEFGRQRSKQINSELSYWDINDSTPPGFLLGDLEVYDARYSELKAIDLKFDEAVSIAETIEDQKIRDALFVFIAEAMVENGKPIDALKITSLTKKKHLPTQVDAFRLAYKNLTYEQIAEQTGLSKQELASSAFMYSLIEYTPKKAAEIYESNIGDPNNGNLGVILFFVAAKEQRYSYLKALLKEGYLDKIGSTTYANIFGQLLTQANLAQARELAALSPTPAHAVAAWSTIGAKSGLSQDFDHARNALTGMCCETKAQSERLLAKNLAKGGYFESAFKLIETLRPSQKSVSFEFEIWDEILNSTYLAYNIQEAVTVVGNKLSQIDADPPNNVWFQYANRILAPNLMTRDLLNQLSSRLKSDLHKKQFVISLVSQHAYVGEFDTLYETILSSDTKTRIKMLTELANFYSYKKKYGN
ncbi:hypothetical protein GUA87_07025 [Sneathiella sp. P13V-1]|uniref:hypothetical protein n=1 Tax=Sneathiella sp. P13V-1 TaxID=2697366 RepID=UPI00187B8F73|nr:hypothetical protein [Sneathiella sp. P13V-1]MBE7636593.1 hypothetical protein [Sneathiella sp. P13V-1]